VLIRSFVESAALAARAERPIEVPAT